MGPGFENIEKDLVILQIEQFPDANLNSVFQNSPGSRSMPHV